jgi:hypothetical protein
MLLKIERGNLRLLADVSEDAAVHVEDVVVDEIAGVAGEEYRRPDQIFASPQRLAGVLARMNASNGCMEPSACFSRSGAVCGVAI